MAFGREDEGVSYNRQLRWKDVRPGDVFVQTQQVEPHEPTDTIFVVWNRAHEIRVVSIVLDSAEVLDWRFRTDTEKEEPVEMYGWRLVCRQR